jgi:predicted transcriptional regulator
MNWNELYCETLETFLKRHNSQSVTGLSTSIGVSRRTLYKWKAEGRPGVDTFQRVVYSLGLKGEEKIIFTISYMLESKNFKHLLTTMSKDFKFTVENSKNGSKYNFNEFFKTEKFNVYGI